MWSGETGIKRIMKIAVPVIINSSTFTVMTFVDRKFLLHHSVEAFSAAAPAGMLAFSAIAFFFGALTFVNNLVAQYFGAERFHSVGKALWAGMYGAVISYLLVLPLLLLAPWFFSVLGHDPVVADLEVSYFSILHAGSIFLLLTNVLSSLFNGVGKTYVVMIVGVFATLLNIPLDYVMIFGMGSFAGWGIEGAALATVLAQAFSVCCYAGLCLLPKYRDTFSLQRWHFDVREFKRLLRFGLPSGVQLVLVHFGFTFFLLMAGRLGTDTQAATNAAWSMDNLLFMPIFGSHIGTAILAGQLIGAGKLHLIPHLMRNALILVLIYVFPMSLGFFFFPEWSLAPLLAGISGDAYQRVFSLARHYLIFVAFYAYFDALGMTVQGVLKAAGDTKMSMYIGFICSFGCMVIPCYFFAVVFELSGSYLWGAATAYVFLNFFLSYARYRHGGWKNLKVIE